MPLDDTVGGDWDRALHVANVLYRFLERALDDNPELMLAVMGACTERLLKEVNLSRTATDTFLAQLTARMADATDE